MILKKGDVHVFTISLNRLKEYLFFKNLDEKTHEYVARS